MFKREKGLTLIELMLVLVVIAILLVIVIVSYRDMALRTNEAATKGSLGALRSAIGNYYANYEGVWPPRLDTDPPPPYHPFLGRYIDKIPSARIRGSDSNRVTYASTPQTPFGGWLYNSLSGHITINHPGVDTRGIYYSTY